MRAWMPFEGPAPAGREAATSTCAELEGTAAAPEPNGQASATRHQ
jgi:hypothetical protein